MVNQHRNKMLEIYKNEEFSIERIVEDMYRVGYIVKHIKSNIGSDFWVSKTLDNKTIEKVEFNNLYDKILEKLKELGL